MLSSSSSLSALVLPLSNNSSSRNSPIDIDYFYYRNYNNDHDNISNIDSRSITSTPVSDIWSLPNTNDDDNVVDNDGIKNIYLLFCFTKKRNFTNTFKNIFFV
jgi:hypothetical protein